MLGPPSATLQAVPCATPAQAVRVDDANTARYCSTPMVQTGYHYGTLAEKSCIVSFLLKPTSEMAPYLDHLGEVCTRRLMLDTPRAPSLAERG